MYLEMVSLVEGIFRRKADLVSKGETVYINGVSQFLFQWRNTVNLCVDGAASETGLGRLTLPPFGPVAMLWLRAAIPLR